MRPRTILTIVIVAASVAVAALGFPFSKWTPLAVLTPTELALKTPAPPDDSCFQTKRALSELGDEKAIRDVNPLSADEVEIYKTVLARWNQGSRTSLNVSSRTTPLDRDVSDCDCLKGIDVQSLAKATRSFHLLTRDVLTKKARLVDAELQSAIAGRNDPMNSIQNGSSVKSAVEQGFSNGLFELSEIAFNKERRRAIVSYSFVCGSLCGSGGVWLFEKVDGIWKKSERICGGWVS
jgi:hypothetical protein